MPWPSYSERLLAHTQPAGGSRSAFVPAGHRAVIKYAHGVNPEGVTGTFAVYVGGWLVHLVRFQATTPFIHQPMMAVAYQGEELRLYMLGQGVVGSIHGFIFADSSGRTGPPAYATQLPTDPGEPDVAP